MAGQFGYWVAEKWGRDCLAVPLSHIPQKIVRQVIVCEERAGMKIALVITGQLISLLERFAR